MSNTPRVYLLPVGSDVLRSPTSSSGATREWRIQEQTLPVPLPISAADLVNTVNWIPEIDTLGAQYGNSRTHASFRAFHDSGSFTATEMTSESRLIGRSVWNTRWMLVIPAGALHSNRREGLDRFVFGAQLPDGTRDGNGVSDIKMFFQTYSYSGE
jgi:hypothetical protein